MGVGLGGVGFGSPGNSNSNFWNWAQGQNVGWNDLAPVGQTILEQNIPTAFSNWKRGLGVADSANPFSRWLDQQVNRYALGYNNYTAANPITANLGGYNATLGSYDDWYREFMKQAPQLRGRDDASRGAGPVRWVGL